jgi:hypothetical protein
MITHHMAMLYARYRQPPDPTKAEEYLQRGLTILSDVDLPDGDRHFLIVFMRKGLALVRLRQDAQRRRWISALKASLD